MRFFPLLALIGAIGYLAYQKFKPLPPPPPPPVPPAIISEPSPVISEDEQQKILKSAEDPDAEVRWEAVMLLDKMKAPAAQQLMFHMLQKDLEPEIRLRVLNLLANRGGKEVVQAVVVSLRDPEPNVRVTALKTLDKIGDYSVAPLIAAGPMKDGEEAVRLQALRTLNSLQDRKQQEIDRARQRYEQEKAAFEKAKAAQQQR